jgi:phospholipase C
VLRVLRVPRTLALAAAAFVGPACSALERHVDTFASGPPCAASDPASARASCGFARGAAPGDTIACPPNGSQIPIEHIIILMQENRSFDHYLGHLPGNGQDDVDVADPAASNPAPSIEGGAAAAAVPWHHVDDACFDDPDHEWAGSHFSWDGGRNDGFVQASAGASDAEGNDPTGARAMGYYDAGDIPFYYQLASTFAISDRYFADVLGPTFPNRLYAYAGTSFGIVSNDIDTGFHPTIFEVLDERGISWKVYQSTVAAGFITLSFAVDSVGKVASIDDFAEDARNGTLPQVAWIDPAFLADAPDRDDEEPPADMQVGQHFVYRQVAALMSSPSWATSAMFITYDEAGGLYDHVPPPPACPPDATPPESGGGLGGFDQYGFRVPLFVVSPYAKAHYVSHVVHSHASILRFIETKHGIPALTARDANSDALLDMFDFAAPAFANPPELAEPAIDEGKLAACRGRYGS